MNLRLLCLAIITAGCFAVIYSRIELMRAEAHGKALLTLTPEKPAFPSKKTSHSDSVSLNLELSLYANIVPSIQGAQAEDVAVTPEESITDRVNKNPESMAKWAECLPAGCERIIALNQVAVAWATQDPLNALSWANSIADSAGREAAVSASLFALADTDPQKALLYEEASDLGERAFSTTEILLAKWAESDLIGAMNCVTQQPPGQLKDELWARTALVAARRYPVEAGQIVANEIAPGSVQTEAVISVLHQWAITDPKGAAAWADNFPEGELRERARNEVSGMSSYVSYSATKPDLTHF